MIDLCERCHETLDPETRDDCLCGLCEDCSAGSCPDCESPLDDCECEADA